MSKTMPNSTKEKKYRWIKPIPDKEITIKQTTKAGPFSERTLKYWLANFRQGIYLYSGFKLTATNLIYWLFPPPPKL